MIRSCLRTHAFVGTGLAYNQIIDIFINKRYIFAKNENVINFQRNWKIFLVGHVFTNVSRISDVYLLLYRTVSSIIMDLVGTSCPHGEQSDTDTN